MSAGVQETEEDNHKDLKGHEAQEYKGKDFLGVWCPSWLQKRDTQMPQRNPSPLFARTANSNHLLLVGENVTADFQHAPDFRLAISTAQTASIERHDPTMSGSCRSTPTCMWKRGPDFPNEMAPARHACRSTPTPERNKRDSRRRVLSGTSGGEARFSREIRMPRVRAHDNTFNAKKNSASDSKASRFPRRPGVTVRGRSVFNIAVCHWLCPDCVFLGATLAKPVAPLE